MSIISLLGPKDKPKFAFAKGHPAETNKFVDLTYRACYSRSVNDLKVRTLEGLLPDSASSWLHRRHPLFLFFSNPCNLTPPQDSKAISRYNCIELAGKSGCICRRGSNGPAFLLLWRSSNKSWAQLCWYSIRIHRWSYDSGSCLA